MWRILHHLMKMKLLFILTLWNCSGKQIWTNFIELKETPFALCLTSNKLWLSVANALFRSINIVTPFYPLPREFIVTIATSEHVSVFPVIFLFCFLRTMAVAPEGFREFHPTSPHLAHTHTHTHTNFQTQ